MNTDDDDDDDDAIIYVWYFYSTAPGHCHKINVKTVFQCRPPAYERMHPAYDRMHTYIRSYAGCNTIVAIAGYNYDYDRNMHPAVASPSLVGCVAQLAERRSLAGELTLSCARPAADG